MEKTTTARITRPTGSQSAHSLYRIQSHLDNATSPALRAPTATALKTCIFTLLFYMAFGILTTVVWADDNAATSEKINIRFDLGVSPWGVFPYFQIREAF